MWKVSSVSETLKRPLELEYTCDTVHSWLACLHYLHTTGVIIIIITCQLCLKRFQLDSNRGTHFRALNGPTPPAISYWLFLMFWHVFIKQIKSWFWWCTAEQAKRLLKLLKFTLEGVWVLAPCFITPRWAADGSLPRQVHSCKNWNKEKRISVNLYAFVTDW